MTKGKTVNRRIDTNSLPTASRISDTPGLDESPGPVCSGRPRFPLAVWTPRTAPVVMGAGGIWARSLIEWMVAAGQPVTSVCLALEGVDSPETADCRSSCSTGTCHDTNAARIQVRGTECKDGGLRNFSNVLGVCKF